MISPMLKNTLESIKNLNQVELIWGFLSFTTFFSSGFLTLFYYKPELVESLETGKVLLFSASLGAPIFAFITILIIAIGPNDHTPESDKMILSGGLYGSTIAMHIALAISYHQKSSIANHVIWLVLMSIVIAIALGLTMKKFGKSNK